MKQYILYIKIIGALLVGLIGWKLYKGASNTGKAVINDIKESAQVAGVQSALNQSGLSSIRSQNVIDTAEDIYSALHKDSFWGMFEDETKAINAFNSLASIEEAKACARIYRTNYGKSLYTDLTKYVTVSKLKTFLYNATKGI